MIKCEYCNFGNWKSFKEVSPSGEVLYGLYGKQINAKDDLLGGQHHFYDVLKLIKSTNGYFIEASVTDEWDHDSYKNYSPVAFCPICGRKLPEFDKKEFFKKLTKKGW